MLRPIRFRCVWSFGCQLYSHVCTRMIGHMYTQFRHAPEIPEHHCCVKRERVLGSQHRLLLLQQGRQTTFSLTKPY